MEGRAEAAAVRFVLFAERWDSVEHFKSADRPEL